MSLKGLKFLNALETPVTSSNASPEIEVDSQCTCF